MGHHCIIKFDNFWILSFLIEIFTFYVIIYFAEYVVLRKTVKITHNKGRFYPFLLFNSFVLHI